MKRDAPGYVLGFMAALCLVCGAAVSLVHYATREQLAANERLHHNRAVAAAFGLEVPARTPEGYERALAEALETATWRDEAGERLVYRWKAGGPGPWGYTFTGMGFWDRIRGFLVLDEEGGRILRLLILDHKETPGLGGRIEESAFLDAFQGLRIAWEKEPGQRLVIGAGAPADAEHRVDALSGATQTSTALMTMLNDELDRIRAIDREALVFRNAPPGRE